MKQIIKHIIFFLAVFFGFAILLTVFNAVIHTLCYIIMYIIDQPGYSLLILGTTGLVIYLINRKLTKRIK
jgi:hypothetical protein